MLDGVAGGRAANMKGLVTAGPEVVEGVGDKESLLAGNTTA